MLVLATITAPPARSRRTIAASASAGAASSASTLEPARVGSPATSNRSLMLTIAPSSGPSDTPCAGARVGGVGRGAGGVGINREAGARPLAFRVGDAGERVFEPVAAGELLA